MNKLKLIGGAALLLGACAGDPSNPSNQAQEIELRASEMRYNRSELHVAKNQAIVLELKNDGQILHDWNLQAPLKVDSRNSNGGGDSGHHHAHEHPQVHMAAADNSTPRAHVAAGPGSKARIQFTPLAAGTYEYYCSVPGHREAGMRGKLMVH